MHRTLLLRGYLPRCPTLYAYGQAKPVMFHTQRWIDRLEEAGGRCECVEDGGHWFMESHPDRVNRWIREWFSPE